MLLGPLLLTSGLIPGAGLAGAAPHPNSFSSSEIHVRGSAFELQLRVQVLSLGEVIEGFDDNLDGHAEPGEIERSKDAIAGYVEEHYRLVPGALSNAEASDAARALRVKDARVFEGPLDLDPMNQVSEWVDVRLTFDAPAEGFDRFGVLVDLFELTSPGHRDLAAVVWNGLELGVWHFSAGANAHVFVASEEMLARNAPAFRRYLRLGLARLASALDLWLLAGMIVLGARRARSSAFASVGALLLAAAVGLMVTPELPLRPAHVRFAALAVPIALAYVALDDLLHAEGRTRLLEPTVFGLILGAREATRLAPEIMLEEAATGPLAGFTTGLVGALTVLMFALCLTRPSRAGTPAFGARLLRSAVSGTALVLAAWTFVGMLTG